MSALRWTRLVLCAFSAVAFFQPASAQSQIEPAGNATQARWSIPSNDSIRGLLAERVKGDTVGIVIGVIEPSGRRVVAYGKSGARNRRPLDGDTVFQIGSVTKVFTGLLLADMVQKGEVKIDDPAAMFLPPGVHMPQRGRPITLIDLSKHWSALPSMPTNFSLAAKPDPYAGYTEAQLYSFLSSYELRREPGRQEYSNLGVALLGRLLARHAGMEYAALLKQRVLDPLELASTTITLSAEQSRRLAPGHDRFLQPVDTWEMSVMPASGSLRSTANDLLTFVSFNLGDKESDLYSAMLYQRTPMRALGWGRSTLGGESVYGHEGGKEGYRSAVVFNPRTKTGVVVLTNARTSERPMDLARHLLFPQSPLPPSAAPAIAPRSVKVKARTLDMYAGEYQLEPEGLLRVARSKDHLLLDIAGEGVATMFPSSDREFYSNTDEIHIVLDVDADGGVSSLTLHEGDTVRRALRVGEPH